VIQEIVIDYPPAYEEIAKAFGLGTKEPVIFSWGDRIYNPTGFTITGELLAHEAVHGMRQGLTEATILDWWQRYMDEVGFRLAEEIPAHRAEYQWLQAHANRKERRAAMNRTADRLAAPLYGRMTTRAEAKRLLRGAA